MSESELIAISDPVINSFDGRFRDHKKIGEGSLGLVYRVHDQETDEDVALKTLPRLVPDDIYQIKEEFRILSGVTHPNLVELHELFVDASRCFFTMELIEGKPFTEHVRQLLVKGTVADIMPLLEQLAQGVAALHAEGRLHRDIKPSNVLVSNAGRVVLLDFDLATFFRSEDSTYVTPARLYGTPHYMPPEQMYGEDLSQAADWYAVGIMLFEAIGGHLPFDGPFQIMLSEKEQGLQTSLRTISPDTPPQLDELVRALLRPDPLQRPGEPEIFEALRGAITSRCAVKFVGAGAGTPFIGRDKEIGALQHAYQAVCRGMPAFVHVTAASGLGKTELVRQFLRSVDEGRTLILRSQCHPQESVPYKAIDRIVDALSRYLNSLPVDVAATLRPARPAALTRVFPVLARVPALQSSEEAQVDLQELRLAGFRALRDLVTRIAALRPLVLWIDDLQWGDEDSAVLLREILRPPNTPPLLLLLSYRREEAIRSGFFARLHDDVLRPWTHEIPLEPLEPQAMHKLATALHRGTGDARIHEIVAESNGSPLVIGLLAAENASAHATSDRVEPRRPLREMIRRRLDGLDAGTRRILHITAVAGRPIERALVLRAAGLRAGRAEVLVLMQRQLLRDARVAERPALQAYHDRIREAILEELPPDQKADCHRSIAEALLSRNTHDHEALVEHWLGAGERRKAGEAAVVAAERAAAALAFDRAAALYRLSLDHSADGRIRRAEFLEKLGEALSMAGRGRESADSFLDAVRTLESAGESSSGALIFDLRRRAAEEYLRSGHVDDGTRALKQVLENVGLQYPATPARALGKRLIDHARLDWRGLSFTPRSLEEVTPADLARIDACWSAGLGLAWIDRVRTWAFQSQFALWALDAGEAQRVSRALSAEASELAGRGGRDRLQKSEQIIKKAVALAEESGDPRSMAFATLMDGSIAFYAGHFRRAVQRCEDARQIARERCRGVAWEMTTANLLGFASRVYLGEVAAVCTALPLLIEEAKSRGDRLAAATLAAGLPNLAWLCMDKPDEAQRRIDEAMSLWGQRDFQLQHYLDLIARVHVDLYLGDGDAAFKRVTAMWPALWRSFYLMVQNFRITLWHLRARAAIAAAVNLKKRKGSPWFLWRRARFDELLRSAEGDAGRIAREDMEWAAPLASSLRAAIAAARGRRNEAAIEFGCAAIAFERVDMALYAAAARRAQSFFVGDNLAADLLRQSESWMAGQGIVCSGKLAWVLIPVEPK